MTSTKSLGWIGEFPAAWDVMPNKALIRKKKVSVGAKADDYPLLSLTKGGVIVRNIDEGGKFPENFDSYQRVSSGDLVTCLFDVPETPRTIGLAKHDGMITGAYDVFEFTERVNPRYFEYYYLALDDRKGLSYFYSGLRNVIRTPVFLSIPTPVPPLDEQKAIANFLDRELAQIDALIEKQGKLLSKLSELRISLLLTSLTGNAVLGLSVDSEESPSPWIRHIPKSWQISKVKFFADVTLGKMIQSHQTETENVEVPYLSSVSIQDTGLELDDSKTMFASAREIRTLAIKANDVLVVEGGSAGRSVLVQNDLDGYVYQNSINRVRVHSGLLLPEFMHFWMSLLVAVGEVEAVCNKATIMHLTAEKLKNLPLIVPPMKEQKSICQFLQVKFQSFENINKATQFALEALSERRQALISAAVTGKIDVRKVA